MVPEIPNAHFDERAPWSEETVLGGMVGHVELLPVRGDMCRALYGGTRGPE
jgi:hypothetical protein